MDGMLIGDVWYRETKEISRLVVESTHTHTFNGVIKCIDGKS